MFDQQERRNSTRREFVQATLVAVAAASLLGVLWLVSRGAPSATRDPAMTPPSLVPTPTPTPQPPATPDTTPRSRDRRKRRRRRSQPTTF